LNAFIGYEGEEGNSYKVKFLKGNVAKFETTRKLKKREGLSIAVNFPGDLVKSGASEPINSPDSSDRSGLNLRKWIWIALLGWIGHGSFLVLIPPRVYPLPKKKLHCASNRRAICHHP